MEHNHNVNKGEAQRDSSYAACLCTLLLFLALLGMVLIFSKLYGSKFNQEVSYLGDPHDSSAIVRDKTISKDFASEATSYVIIVKQEMTSPKSFTTSITSITTSKPVSNNKTTLLTTKYESVFDKSSKEAPSRQRTSETSSTTLATTVKNKSEESAISRTTKHSFTVNTVNPLKTSEKADLVTQSYETNEPAETVSFLNKSAQDNTERTTNMSSYLKEPLAEKSTEMDNSRISPSGSQSSESVTTFTTDMSSHLTEHQTEESSEMSDQRVSPRTETSAVSDTTFTTDMFSHLTEHQTEKSNEMSDPIVSPSSSQPSSESHKTVTTEMKSYSSELVTSTNTRSNSELLVTSPKSVTNSFYLKEFFIVTSDPPTNLGKMSPMESTATDITKKDATEKLSPTSILNLYSTLFTTSKSTTQKHNTLSSLTKLPMNKLEKRKIPASLITLTTSGPSKTVVSINNRTTNPALIKANTPKTPANHFEDGVLVFEDDVELMVGANKTIKREQGLFKDLKMSKIEISSPAIHTTASCSNHCVVRTCPVCEVADCPEIPTSTLPPVTTPKPEPKVCKTSQCQVVAGRILSLVNISVDPCEDFYSYACGGILNNPLLLEEDSATDVWSRIEEAVIIISKESPVSHQKFGNFYEGCLKYDYYTTMDSRREQGRSVLDSVAYFLDSSSNPEDEFVELLIKFFQLGSEPLFRLQLDVDSVNSSQFQLVISPPDWLLSHFLSPEEKSQRCRHKAADSIPLNTQEAFTIYESCMRNVSDFLEMTEKALEFFQIFSHLPPYNSSQLIQEIRMSMELDLMDLLSKYPPRSSIEKDKQFKNYKLWTKIKLDTEMPSISWGYLFSSLLKVEIQDITNVQIYFSEQITEFVKQLSSKNPRTLQNMMMALLAHNLYTELVVTHDLCNRGRYCLRVAAGLMPYVASNLYLATFSSHHINETRKQAVQIYTQLVAEMEENLKTASWLDANSISEVKNKLRFTAIQFPPIFSEFQLDDSLGECSLNDRQYLKGSVCLVKHLQVQTYSRYTMDPHTANSMNIHLQYSCCSHLNHLLLHIIKDMKTNFWWPHFLTSFSTETIFIYGLNTYMVPQAVLTEFDSQMPRQILMARLGFMLAQGIAHSFDQTGVKYTAGGKFGQMLSESAYPFYQEVVDTSNSLFSFTRSYKEGSLTYEYLLDPELTLNQRLSDITAANLAQTSASRHLADSQLLWVPFSPTQLFYITLAQSFCSKKKMAEIFTTLYEGTKLLPFVRVFNIASSSEQFALAFQCLQGSPMNVQDLMKTRPFPLFQTEPIDY